jgi:hypothetical protein
MIEIFYYYVVTLAFICITIGLLLVYRYYLGNRLNAQANKLKSQIANLKQTYPELEDKRGSLVASGIKDIGIEGIMSELGIDPSIIKNPLVKGLIDRYAPRIIDQLSKKVEGGQNSFNEQSFM